MRKNDELEKCCSLCEHSEEVFGGDYYICKKKGVVDPNGLCRAFCFDPLMIRVSVQKIPEFKPFPVEDPASATHPATNPLPKPVAPLSQTLSREIKKADIAPEQEAEKTVPAMEDKHKYHFRKAPKKLRPTAFPTPNTQDAASHREPEKPAAPEKKHKYRIRRKPSATTPQSNNFVLPEERFFMFSEEMSEVFPEEDLEQFSEEEPFLSPSQ